MPKLKQSLALSVIIVLLLACKAKQKTSSSDVQKPVVASTTVSTTDTNKPSVRPPFARRSHGVVSHKYLATGCKAVIISNEINSNGDTLIYLPMGGLDGFDSAGMKISFTYSRLNIMNQKGCVKAEPVIIRNVKREN